MPKISIIVPVYNVENYLPQCMESILNQTLRDIEIICVDDGSTDNSGKILDQYAGRDSRVTVLHRHNAGYGAAMNAGMDAAAGDYIGIVESDDCIRQEMYDVLYAAASRDSLDLVKSDAVYWIEGAGYERTIHYSQLDGYYDRVLHDEDRNIFFDFFMNIWTGIYKREFLVGNNIRFHESPGASYQDNGFWLQTLLYCQSAKWISRAFYLYRQDNPAASVKSRSKMMAMTGEYEFLAQVLCDRKAYHLLPYCYYYRMFRHKGTFMRIADGQKREFCDQIRADYLKYKGYVRGNAGLDRWLREAAVRPDEMCGEAIAKKTAVSGRLKRAEKIIIYGAGKHGDIVFRDLYNEGCYDRICCFAVSQAADAGERIGGKDILSIHDAHRLYPGALCIIAVVRGSGMYHQMAGTLEKIGITDYLAGTDIEESFYTTW